jgi:hypothetical protein
MLAGHPIFTIPHINLCFIVFDLRNVLNAVAGLRGPVGDSVRLARTCSKNYRIAISYI